MYKKIWVIKSILFELYWDNLKNDTFNKPMRGGAAMWQANKIFLQAYSNKRPPVLFSRVPVLFLNGAGSLSAAVGEPSWREVTVTNFYNSRKMANNNKDEKRSWRSCFRIFAWTRNHAFTDLHRRGVGSDRHKSVIIFILHKRHID